MDALHEWYDTLRAGRDQTPRLSVAAIKLALAGTELDAETFLTEAQQHKNTLNDRIDRLIAEVRACEREILELEEDMKWANELKHVVREWVHDEFR